MSLYSGRCYVWLYYVAWLYGAWWLFAIDFNVFCIGYNRGWCYAIVFNIITIGYNSGRCYVSASESAGFFKQIVLGCCKYLTEKGNKKTRPVREDRYRLQDLVVEQINNYVTTHIKICG